jgi:hypothetical protein
MLSRSSSARVWAKVSLLNATMPTTRRGSRASHKDVDPPKKKLKRDHASAMSSAAAEGERFTFGRGNPFHFRCAY